jgi:hypothetical protein
VSSSRRAAEAVLAWVKLSNGSQADVASTERAKVTIGVERSPLSFNSETPPQKRHWICIGAIKMFTPFFFLLQLCAAV